MVFFADKDNSPFSITNPTGFLSQRAISRRQKHGLAILAADIPVNESYVQTLNTLGLSTYFRTKWLNGVLVEMPPAMVNNVEALPFVNRVELVAPGAQLLDEEIDRGPPGSPIAVAPESQMSTDFQNEMVGVLDMHAQGYDGEGVMIGVLDSGFPNLSRIDAFQHLNTDNRILLTHDYTFNQRYVESGDQHGLRVLSVLAAQKEDFRGTAPEASYLLFITEDSQVNSEHRIEEYNWLFAAEAADSAGVDIISTSVGYSTFTAPSADYTYDDMDGQTTVISRAAGMAFDRGILVLTSAGNEGNQVWQFITAPADHPDILAVGAVNSALSRTRASSIGPNSAGVLKPDVAALGSGTSTINENGFIQLGSGTSFSAPLVSGVAAGLLQAEPELTNDRLARAIRASGSQASRPDNELGYGIVNFRRALASAGAPIVEGENNLLVYPNPAGQSQTSMSITFSSDDFGADQFVQLFSFDGRTLAEITVVPNNIKDTFSISWGDSPPGMYLLRVTSSNGKLTRKLIKY